MKKTLLLVLMAIICIVGGACMTVNTTVELPHFHEYDGVWSMTETDHSRMCIECNVANEATKAPHVWDEKHTCSVCGYEGEHTWGEAHVCTVCDLQGEHVWDNTHTCTVCDLQGEHAWDNTHKCIDCEYQGEHDFGTIWTENKTDKTHVYTCACTATQIKGCDCWDGVVGTLPSVEDNVMIINTAGELAAFSEAVNGGNNYSGVTVKLGADINLGNQPFTPIGSSSSHAFRGNFDGQEHTVSNIKITVTNDIETTEAGLFGWIGSSTIKNVTVFGVDISGEKRVGGIVGYCEAGALIENCHVENATLVGDRVGGIIGLVNDRVTMRNCSATDATITAVQSQGKLLGWNNNIVSENNKAVNVTLVATLNDTIVLEGEEEQA